MPDKQFAVEKCDTGWVLVDQENGLRSALPIQDATWLLRVADKANRQGQKAADEAIGGDWVPL